MFYANGLFSALVMEDVLGKATSPSAIMRQSLTLSVLPLAGFAVAGLYIARSRWSLRTLQLAGFAAMTALYLGLSLGYEAVRTAPALFITLYAMTFLFANAGPTARLSSCPRSCSGPTRRRATASPLPRASWAPWSAPPAWPPSSTATARRSSSASAPSSGSSASSSPPSASRRTPRPLRRRRRRRWSRTTAAGAARGP
eukprot:TRINITY_DN15144_c0_g1_i1.p2 TRINITY_DN15144_c0_g1~~TRINITY_DN15144_c0_g1_i1.p2  ORF type:complete len:232 (-),score=27.23 TRINITY_DN15144_c0_g1_i1:237-833(-)